MRVRKRERRKRGTQKRSKCKAPSSMDCINVPCTGYVLPEGYLSHRNRKSEARGRSRHRNNIKRVGNMQGRNVGTIREKSPKQGLTSTENLTIEISEGRITHYQITYME